MPATSNRIRVLLALGTVLGATPSWSDQSPYFRFRSHDGVPPGASTGGSGGSTGSNGGSTGTTDPGATTGATDPNAPTDPNQLQALTVDFRNYTPPTVGQDVQSGQAYTLAQYQRGVTRFAIRGLPPGLSLNVGPQGTPDGYAEVVGTPTQAGAFSGTVTATDEWGQTGTTSFTMYVSGDPTDPNTKPSFYLPRLDNLFVNQASRVQAQYLPQPQFQYQPQSGCLTFTIKSGGSLPPGMAMDTGCHQAATNLFSEGQNTPSVGGNYGPYVFSASVDGGTPIDSEPTSIVVGQPDLAVNVTPLLVKADPGAFESGYSLRGSANYGSTDLIYDGQLNASNVTLDGTVPQGLTWNPNSLTFNGTATKAGESQTLSFTVRYGGQTMTSKSFTIQVNNVIAPYVVYSNCYMSAPPPPPFGSGGPPVATCQDANPDPAPSVIPVSYMTDPDIRILDQGGQVLSVTLASGSLPAGLSMNSRGEIRGQTSATGDYPVTFAVSANGFPSRTMGPYTLQVGDQSTQVTQPPDWFIPGFISVGVPYVEGSPPSCSNPFPASEGPYSNVYAVGAPSHMSVQSDGTVCSVGLSSPQAVWDSEQHQTTGTVTATSRDGSTFTKQVQFNEIAYVH